MSFHIMIYKAISTQLSKRYRFFMQGIYTLSFEFRILSDILSLMSQAEKKILTLIGQLPLDMQQRVIQAALNLYVFKGKEPDIGKEDREAILRESERFSFDDSEAQPLQTLIDELRVES